jgi:hypothetical protein
MNRTLIGVFSRRGKIWSGKVEDRTAVTQSTVNEMYARLLNHIECSADNVSLVVNYEVGNRT